MMKMSRTVLACALSVLLLAATVADVKAFTINTGNYKDLSTYPGIRTFDYPVSPVREEIEEECMVEPDYTFRIADKTIDEYYGTTGNFTGNSGTYKGVYLSKNKKGKCGVRYNKLFRYQDDWIDVKTTYIDWDVQDSAKAFVNGGFCRVRWSNVKYVRLRHEFFKSGTDERVDIKGFFTFTDLDDNQGIGLIPSEVKHIWMNKNGSVLKYKTTEEGYLFIKDSKGASVDGPTSPSYNPQLAAKNTFSYTFEGSTHDQFILDGHPSSGGKTIGFESAKVIPSSIPEEDETMIRKEVSVEGDEFGESNQLRSWNAEWEYRVSALVPLETEEGNFLDDFSITDQIDPCLAIASVKVLRGTGSDVTDLFQIDTDQNRVQVTAKDMHDQSMYGYTYFLLIDVSVAVTKEELRDHGHFIDENTALIKNTATVSYADGNGTYDRQTNETETEIVFPYSADITITKRIKTEELYWDHGTPSFVVRLNGTERESGEEVEYNKVITFSPEYVEEQQADGGFVERSVVFQDVREGSYRCQEYAVIRYRLDRITEVAGGEVKGEQTDDRYVAFEVDDRSPRKATFVNRKARWDQYSDSGCIVNKFVE